MLQYAARSSAAALSFEALVFDDVFFFPCIFRVAIGNSESQIEKRQVEKCKVLPLQEQQEETPQGKMQRFKSAKNTRHVK